MLKLRVNMIHKLRLLISRTLAYDFNEIITLKHIRKASETDTETIPVLEKKCPNVTLMAVFNCCREYSAVI